MEDRAARQADVSKSLQIPCLCGWQLVVTMGPVKDPKHCRVCSTLNKFVSIAGVVTSVNNATLMSDIVHHHQPAAVKCRFSLISAMSTVQQPCPINFLPVAFRRSSLHIRLTFYLL